MKDKFFRCWIALAFVGPVFGADDERAGDERADADPPPTPGWMGVKLGQVPEPLRAQLGLKDGGLLVLNIAANSPADTTDLHRYDVIVEFAGHPVPSDIMTFAESVRKTGAEATIELKIYRDAKPKILSLVLRKRPEARYAYKYEEEPEEIWRDHFDVMGKVLRRTPDGRWRIDDLWTPDHLPKGLEEFFENHARDLGNVESWRWPGGQRWKSRFREFKDGSGIEIEKLENGTITVRRSSRSGDVEKVEKKSYHDEAELKKADPKAYKLYIEMKTGRGGPLRSFAMPNSRIRDKWMESLNRHFDNAWRGRTGTMGRPFTSFTEDEQGIIEVVIRRPDGEVKKTYKDRAEMRMRDPKLYARFQEILGSPEAARAADADEPVESTAAKTR